MRVILLAAFCAPFVAAVGYLRDSPQPVEFTVSMVTYALAGSIISLPRWNGSQFPVMPTVLVTALFLIAAQQGYAATPVTHQAGQTPWFHLGFIAVLFGLGMRRRPGWACVVLVGVAVLSVSRWPVIHGVVVPIEMYHVVGIAVVVVTWMVEQQHDFFMRRMQDTRRLLATARSRDEAEKGMRYASSRRVDEVRRLAGGLLQRIAKDPAEVTDYDVQQFRLTEAQLRDSIRGRSIATPHILELTRAARARGITVDILDERGGALCPEVVEAAEQQLSTILAAARTGAVTVRALPPGDPTAVFIVHDSHDPEADPVAVEIADGTGGVSAF